MILFHAISPSRKVGACFKINNSFCFVAAKITVIFAYYLTPININSLKINLMVHGVEFTLKEALGLSWNYLDNEDDNYPFSLKIEGVFPEHALHEYKGTFGGYDFQNDTLKFRTPNGIRSTGHEACAVFNQASEGVIFFKQ